MDYEVFWSPESSKNAARLSEIAVTRPGRDGRAHKRSVNYDCRLHRITMEAFWSSKCWALRSPAVLIDATVVRMVVGPALLQLAGDWNWWPFGLYGAPEPEKAYPMTTKPWMSSDKGLATA